MNHVELAQPERRGVVRLTPEQEARLSVAQLTQSVLDLGVRHTEVSQAYTVMYAFEPTNPERAKKKGEMPMSSRSLFMYDKDYTVLLLYRETPVSLSLIVSGVDRPAPNDSVKVLFERKGVSQGYTMIGGPMRLDESPATPETTLDLVAQAQTLVDRIKQA